MFWESMLRLPYILRRLEVYIFRGGRGAANGVAGSSQFFKEAVKKRGRVYSRK